MHQKLLWCSIIAFLLWDCSIESCAGEPPVTDLEFTADGKTLVGVSQTGILEFDWPNLRLQRTLKSSATNLHCLEFSPDGKLLAVGGGNPSEVGITEVFTWPDRKKIAEFSEHDDSVLSLKWLDDKQLLSASLDRQIRLHDLSNGDSRISFLGHSRGVSGLSVLPDRSAFVSVAHDQSVRVWDAATGKLIRSLSQHTDPIHGVALRPSESGLPMITTAASDRTIRFWQPTIGRMVRFVRLKAEPLKVAWMNEGDLVVAVCDDGQLRTIDPAEVKVIREIPVFDGWIYSVAVHRTDGSVAVGGSDGQIRRIKLVSKGEVDQSSVR